MAVIENFNNLTQEELLEFVNKIIKTVNSEHIFSNDITFELDTSSSSGIEISEFDGNLYIPLTHKDLLSVPRKAEWSCETEDDIYHVEDPDFEDWIYEDAEKVLKTLSTELDGYKLSISVDDAESEETTDVDVDDYHADDDGIGSYEYWGHVGYDSHPFYAVEGTITQDCTCYLTLVVEPLN